MPASAPTDRRRLLHLAAAGAATLWLPRGVYGQRRWSTDPFSLGVASGAPATDSVVLWTRLLAPGAQSLGRDPVAVRWEVAHDAQFGRIAQRGETLAQAELAHSVHVEVPGLEPDRWYFYRFIAGEAVSATGRTRTLPEPGAAVPRLRLAYASCQRWEHGYFSAWRHMLAEEPDAVLFLGDYIYEYGGASNAVRTPPGGWVDSLEGYRQRYALYKGDAALQAMHAACPWLLTWDDHEVQNDYAGPTPGYNGAEPEPPGGFGARRAAAYQAYYEHMPLRAAVLTRAVAGLAAGAELRLHERLRFGNLATLHLLDARQYKDPQVCTRDGRRGSSTLDPGTCAAWDDPRRTLLGAAQEAWLDAGLAQPQGAWSVIGQQSLFGQRDFRPGPGQSFWNDGWDGYGAARGRLAASLQRHQVANPVLLGGDVHENWVGHVKADYARPDSAVLGVEFCGTSISSRSGGNVKTAERLAENPHFVFADAQRKGYGLADFTPGSLTTTLRVVDDVTQPETRIETLARFAVQAGQRRVEPA
ncbi:MAG: alkaline phosphatase [Comamonadaceae bacterium]|nr:MAG: alkaline phosphatase [Comamonadaceae bacterium]